MNFLRLFKRLMKRKHQVKPTKVLQSSLSDNFSYPELCLQASLDNDVFQNFRRSPTYNEILEHVSETEGAEYLKLISQNPKLHESLNSFRENDLLGNPRVYDYPNVGQFSPTTLRYVKVLGDLIEHFGSLDNLRICEIGIGYGGQCNIINKYFSPASYCLVDLKPALMLAQRYLDHYVTPAKLSYLTLNELGRESFDLVISNYAFTELPRNLQNAYLEKAVAPATRGYLTYNEINPKEWRSYTAMELVAILKNARIVPEVPLSHEKNCIIVWGSQKP
jgi:putative sugar O-methyltransferase